MIGSLVLIGGLILAMAGTTVAISAAAMGRRELARWISQRLRGAAVATTLFSARGRVLRSARALAAVGVVGSAFGVAALAVRHGAIIEVLGAILLGTPLIAVAVIAVPRTAGRRWPQTILRLASPAGDWVSRGLLWAFPAPSAGATPRVTGSFLAHGERATPGDLTITAGVLAFTQKTVRDVMTPRTDIVALEEGTTASDVARLFAESGYSRIPVFRGSLDNVVGMIYAFDLLKVPAGGDLPVRPVVMAPGSKECPALLLELQRKRRQLAMVLDEFGGTAGLVTLEDLLEELVGEIFDEGGPGLLGDGPEIVEVDGSTLNQEISAKFGVPLPGEAETIGGLLSRKAGRIPMAGERLTLNGLEFDVIDASSTRVRRVIVRREGVRHVNLDRTGGS